MNSVWTVFINNQIILPFEKYMEALEYNHTTTNIQYESVISRSIASLEVLGVLTNR